VILLGIHRGYFVWPKIEDVYIKFPNALERCATPNVSVIVEHVCRYTGRDHLIAAKLPQRAATVTQHLPVVRD